MWFWLKGFFVVEEFMVIFCRLWVFLGGFGVWVWVL